MLPVEAQTIWKYVYSAGPFDPLNPTLFGQAIIQSTNSGHKNSTKINLLLPYIQASFLLKKYVHCETACIYVQLVQRQNNDVFTHAHWLIRGRGFGAVL